MNMGRPKRADGSVKAPVTTMYIPYELKVSFQEKVCKRKSISMSRRICELIQEDIQRNNGGDTPSTYPYNTRTEEKNQLRKKEQGLQDMLEKIAIPINNLRTTTAFEVLRDFAMSLARKGAFENSETTFKDIPDIQDVRQKLLRYQFRGTERFDRSQRLIYIEYLDCKIKRLLLEKELEGYLLKAEGGERLEV